MLDKQNKPEYGYDLYVYDENGEIVEQTHTGLKRTAYHALSEVKFLVGTHEGYTYHTNWDPDNG